VFFTQRYFDLKPSQNLIYIAMALLIK
jgi:hypothetical protein